MFVLFTNIAKKLFLPAIEAASASEKADHSRNGQTVEIVLTDRALQDGRQDTRIKKDNKMKIVYCSTNSFSTKLPSHSWAGRHFQCPQASISNEK